MTYRGGGGGPPTASSSNYTPPPIAFSLPFPYFCNRSRNKQTHMNELDKIKEMIGTGRTEEAIFLLDAYIEKYPEEDEAYYLRGNAYRKRQDVRQAINNYLQAMALNPDSPARQTYNMLIDIMDFHDKDLFNQ